MVGGVTCRRRRTSWFELLSDSQENFPRNPRLRGQDWVTCKLLLKPIPDKGIMGLLWSESWRVTSLLPQAPTFK